MIPFIEYAYIFLKTMNVRNAMLSFFLHLFLIQLWIPLLSGKTLIDILINDFICFYDSLLKICLAAFTTRCKKKQEFSYITKLLTRETCNRCSKISVKQNKGTQRANSKLQTGLRSKRVVSRKITIFRQRMMFVTPSC